MTVAAGHEAGRVLGPSRGSCPRSRRFDSDPRNQPAIALVRRLREARDGLRRLYGEQYDERVEPLRAMLRPHAARLFQVVLKAAAAAEAAGDAGTAWPILAAAVDVAEEVGSIPERSDDASV